MDESKYIIAGYKVMEDEGLPKPTYIRFKYYKNGTRKNLGGCRKHLTNTDFRINVNTTKAHFILDKKGFYFDRNTKQYYRREAKLRSDDEILETLAHEIAHVKFWDHDTKHKSYTNHIMCKLRTEVDAK